MPDFLDKFRKKVVASVWKEPQDVSVKNIDDRIALGVLLWAVAEADNEFLPQEKEQIRQILSSYSKMPADEINLVLSAVRQANEERVDIYKFSHKISENLSYQAKLSIIEDLFRVGCADKDLDAREIEQIRQISGLFNISHKDFIDAKIKVKKEFGIGSV